MTMQTMKSFSYENFDQQMERSTGVETLQTLHKSVAVALNEMVQCAMSGLEYTTQD